MTVSVHVARLSSPDYTAASARAQLDQAAAMAATFADTQRRLVATLIELWPTAAWLAAGATSAKAWLLAYTTLSYHEAHRLESVAELCAAHPSLADAVISGTLAIKRAATLARFVTPARAPYLDALLGPLLELNDNTADDDTFTTAIRFWAGQVDQETQPHTPRPHTLALTPSLFGGGELHGQFSPSAFATICAAIAGWTQDPDPTDAPYQRSLRERQADALDDLCAASLTDTEDPDTDDDPEGDTFDGFAPTDTLDEWLAATEAGEDITDLDALRRRLRTMEKIRRRRTRRRTRIRSGATINAIVDIRTLLGLRDATDLEDLVLRGDGWHLTRDLLERLVCDSGLLATLFVAAADSTHPTPIASAVRWRRLPTTPSSPPAGACPPPGFPCGSCARPAARCPSTTSARVICRSSTPCSSPSSPPS